MFLSSDTVNNLFLDWFVYNDNFNPEALHDFMELMSKDGSIDCPVESLGSVVNGLIESNE